MENRKEPRSLVTARVIYQNENTPKETVSINRCGDGLCFYVFEDLKPNEEIMLDSLLLGIRQQKARVVWTKCIKEDLWKAGVRLL